MDNSPSSPPMLQMEYLWLADSILHERDERIGELYRAIHDNTASLATTCGHISAMLEIAEQEPDAVWAVICELTSIYDQKCDEGIQLMIELDSVERLDEIRKMTRLYLRTAAQLVYSTTQSQPVESVQNPSDA